MSRQVGDLSLRGKIVVVTGGGSGIGLCTVKDAVAAGAKVILGDLKLGAEAEAFVKQQESAVVFQQCDVTKKKDLERLVTLAKERWGEVPDVYVASAGLFEPAFSNFWTDTEEDGYTTVDVNVNHPIKLTRIAMRALMGADKKGVVVLISSIAGLAGTYAVPLYCATKHAIVGFTKCMKKADPEEGVKVVTLCPGVVRTPLWSPSAGTNLIDDFKYHDASVLEPEDVARTALELAQEAKYPGGTILELTRASKRVIPDWNVSPPPNPEVNAGTPQEIVPPLKVTVEQYLKTQRDHAKL